MHRPGHSCGSSLMPASFNSLAIQSQAKGSVCVVTVVCVREREKAREAEMEEERLIVYEKTRKEVPLT